MSELSQSELIRELKDRINELKKIKYGNQSVDELNERNRKRRVYQQKKRDRHLKDKDYTCVECNTFYSGITEIKRHFKTIGHRRRLIDGSERIISKNLGPIRQNSPDISMQEQVQT